MQQGRIVFHRFESNVLKSNPLKDPYIRDVVVYLPPRYSQTNAKGYTAVMYLAAYGSSGKMLLNVDPFGETIEARMNRLILEKNVVRWFSCSSIALLNLGGSQYINSTATGMYEEYTTNEIVR